MRESKTIEDKEEKRVLLKLLTWEFWPNALQYDGANDAKMDRWVVIGDGKVVLRLILSQSPKSPKQY